MSPRWLVLDTETTGIPRGSACDVRAVSVGVCLAGPDGPLEAPRTLLVCPPVWSEQAPQAEAVHGLSRAHVERHGKSPAEAWAWLNGYVAEWQPHGLLAWNAAFDAEILARLARDAGQSAPLLWPTVELPGGLTAPDGCLMRLYRGMMPGRASLAAALAALGLPGRAAGHHGAGEDAHLAATVLGALCRRAAA